MAIRSRAYWLGRLHDSRLGEVVLTFRVDGQADSEVELEH
jgi:hypothetical protein